MESGRLVAGERDQADVWVVVAESSGCRDPVEQRHVQVEHDGVGVEIVGELDRLETVPCGGDDGEPRLSVDQIAERRAERDVVVGNEDADGADGRIPHGFDWVQS